MDNKPKTLFVAGVVKGISDYDSDSNTVIICSDANDIKFKVRTTDRLYQKIRIGKHYLIVYLEGEPCKIIAIWLNPSVKKIIKTSNEIKKFGTIIQKGRIRRT